jgi:hypothetical protein
MVFRIKISETYSVDKSEIYFLHQEGIAMISICCTEPKPDYKILSHDEYREFCHLVHQLRKQGYPLKDAQDKAYHQVLVESIPFN